MRPPETMPAEAPPIDDGLPMPGFEIDPGSTANTVAAIRAAFAPD